MIFGLFAAPSLNSCTFCNAAIAQSPGCESLFLFTCLCAVAYFSLVVFVFLTLIGVVPLRTLFAVVVALAVCASYTLLMVQSKLWRCGAWQTLETFAFVSACVLAGSGAAFAVVVVCVQGVGKHKLL